VWREPCHVRARVSSTFAPTLALASLTRLAPQEYLSCGANLVRFAFVSLRRPRRVDGFPYVGIHRYSLRFSTHARRALFVEAVPVARAHAEILRTAAEDQFAVLAYCFMPDHLHLVVEGTSPTSDLRRFTKVSKQRVDYVFRTQLEIRSTWQEGYYDRVLRSDQATEVVIRYVLENPVRAGLVTRAEDYPYSGAMFWPVHFQARRA